MTSKYKSALHRRGRSALRRKYGSYRGPRGRASPLIYHSFSLLISFFSLSLCTFQLEDPHLQMCVPLLSPVSFSHFKLLHSGWYRYLALIKDLKHMQVSAALLPFLCFPSDVPPIVLSRALRLLCVFGHELARD